MCLYFSPIHKTTTRYEWNGCEPMATRRLLKRLQRRDSRWKRDEQMLRPGRTRRLLGLPIRQSRFAKLAASLHHMLDAVVGFYERLRKYTYTAIINSPRLFWWFGGGVVRVVITPFTESGVRDFRCVLCTWKLIDLCAPVCLILLLCNPLSEANLWGSLCSRFAWKWVRCFNEQFWCLLKFILYF